MVGLVMVEGEGLAVVLASLVVEEDSPAVLQQLTKNLGLRRSDMLLRRENNMKCPGPASTIYHITILP